MLNTVKGTGAEDRRCQIRNKYNFNHTPTFPMHLIMETLLRKDVTQDKGLISILAFKFIIYLYLW